MPTEKDLIDERKRKLVELRERGINPYPYRFEVKAKSLELHEKYDHLKVEEITTDETTIAGRIIALRRIGKITFMHLLDGDGKIQAYFSAETLDDYGVLKLFDRGDWIGVEGTIFKTKTGEVTINAKNVVMLSKSLRPLPEKWHGLKDKEIRYRKRYVDLIMNSKVKEVFVTRSHIIKAMKNSFDNKGFLEVETPILSAQYGGANARPFSSTLHALNDMKVYMRISNELFLKRLIIGGFDKVYEFSVDFRNEGVDRTHNPEFTQVEFYEAYSDLNDVMEHTEDVILAGAKAVQEGTIFSWGEHQIQLKKPFERLTMVNAIKKYAHLDISSLSDDDLRKKCEEYQLDIVGKTRGLLIVSLFEGLVEEKLIQPVFITEHPKETTPLCKESREDNNFVERFELFIGGMEFANAYSELNDPIKQRELLEEQAEQLRGGAEEAHPMDEDFIESMEYAMPPTGGVGIGIDRLTMLLTNQQGIRDVLLFPFMKPLSEENIKEKEE